MHNDVYKSDKVWLVLLSSQSLLRNSFEYSTIKLKIQKKKMLFQA